MYHVGDVLGHHPLFVGPTLHRAHELPEELLGLLEKISPVTGRHVMHVGVSVTRVGIDRLAGEGDRG